MVAIIRLVIEEILPDFARNNTLMTQAAPSEASHRTCHFHFTHPIGIRGVLEETAWKNGDMVSVEKQYGHGI